jgi:hypothetical protein
LAEQVGLPKILKNITRKTAARRLKKKKELAVV